MSALRAAQLMSEHHQRIAQAVVRQQQRLIPRYRQMNVHVLERNMTTILGGLQQLAEMGSDRRLMQILSDVAQIRQLGGVTLPEFLTAALCFLPVLRRFFMEKTGDAAEAMQVYASVEAIAVPLMARISAMYLDSGTLPGELTDGPRIPSAHPNLALVELPFTIEPVVGDANVERRAMQPLA